MTMYKIQIDEVLPEAERYRSERVVYTQYVENLDIQSIIAVANKLHQPCITVESRINTRDPGF